MAEKLNLLSLVIGHRIRQKRKELKMSQVELGKAIGSQSMISHYESAKILPPAEVLELIAAKLEDPRMVEYLQQLKENSKVELAVTHENYRDFLPVLEDHSGRWQRPHNEVSKKILKLLYVSDLHGEINRFVKLIGLRSEDPTVLTEAKFYLGGSLLRQGKYSEAQSALEAAYADINFLPEELRARLHYNMGYLFTYLDFQGLALWHASQAVRAFNEVFIPSLQAKAMALQGTIHVELGQFDQARLILTRALEVLNSVNDFDTGRILNTMADADLLTDNYEAAEEYAKQALLRVKAEDFLCQSDIYRVLTEIEFRRGNNYAAEGYLKLSFEYANNAKDATNEAHLCLLAIEVSTDFETKIKHATRAFELTRDTGDYHIHAFACEYMANLLKQSDGPIDEILFYMNSALGAYRTHVEKHSKFSITARRIRILANSLT